MPSQPGSASATSPGQTSSSSTVISIYRYNPHGQLQLIIYPDGSTYTYQYNPQGDKIRETSQTGKAWTYVHDQSHHPVAVIDPEGRMTHNVVPAATPKAQ